MGHIVYNDRQMKDFFNIFIHPVDILKMGRFNLKIPSLKLDRISKQMNCIHDTNGRN